MESPIPGMLVAGVADGHGGNFCFGYYQDGDWWFGEKAICRYSFDFVVAFMM